MPSDLERFEQLRIKAKKLGYGLRKADNPNPLKQYTLTRHGVETHYANLDELSAALDRVKPVKQH